MTDQEKALLEAYERGYERGYAKGVEDEKARQPVSMPDTTYLQKTIVTDDKSWPWSTSGRCGTSTPVACDVRCVNGASNT